MVVVKTGNFFEAIKVLAHAEQTDPLLVTETFRLERIVSKAHATPEGEWYDQAWGEWVMLLQGSAGLRIEGGAEAITLRPGDYICLPAHLRHRVDWTDPTQDTVWLALHYQP